VVIFAKAEAVEGVRLTADLNGSVPHGRGQAPFTSEPDRRSGENERRASPPPLPVLIEIFIASYH